MTNFLLQVSDIAPPGMVLAGKYTVEKTLGEGGMGVVVAAYHELLGQRVAVKFLRPHLCQDQGVVGRFVREARLAAKVQSEHVARVIDVGNLEGGSPYMVMEYLEGHDLGDVLHQDGPLPAATAIDYVFQACEAIAEAHKIGIVHRDLKPSNLFLTKRPDGSSLIKVLDFGISKFTEQATNTPMEAAALTTTQNILGSPLYMSPEQLRSAKNVDVRADIWALGVILYELIAGIPPFMGESVSHLLTVIVADPHEPLIKVAPAVPQHLSDVIDRCLAKKREDRFTSVAQLTRELLPHAPRHARLSVERISRLLGDELPPESLASTRIQLDSGGHPIPPTSPEPAPNENHPSAPSNASHPQLDMKMVAGVSSQSSTAEPVSSARSNDRSQTPEKKSRLPIIIVGSALALGLAILFGSRSSHSPDPTIAKPITPAVADSTAPIAATTEVPPQPAQLAPIDSNAVAVATPAVDAGIAAATSTPAKATAPKTPQTPHPAHSAKPASGFDPLGGRN